MSKSYIGDEFLDLLREVAGRIQYVKEIGISNEELLRRNQVLKEAVEALINEGKEFINDMI
jgi:hypothetical protein